MGRGTMERILHTPVSGLHVMAALLAVFFGTLVVWLPKGTPLHRQVGYAYVGCMLAVNVTAFGIYSLFGRFGLVHWGAVGSLLMLMGGIGIPLLKQSVPNWRRWHEGLMSASVAGLYAAGLVESTYRLAPPHLFWWVCLAEPALVFLAGGWLLYHRPDSGPVYTQNALFRRSELRVSQKKIEKQRAAA